MKKLLYLEDQQLKQYIEKIFLGYRETAADAKKILLSARVCNNLDPDGTTIGLSSSPFISIETLPVETNLDLAAIITSTNKSTIPQNEATPNIKSILIFIKIYLQMT